LRYKITLKEVHYKTRTAEISLESEGYIKIKILEDSVIDEGDAIDNFLVVKNLSAGKKHLKLLDFRGKWSMTNEAREISRKNISPDNTVARAYLTDSYFSKLTREFFETFNRPDVPQKFFTCEEEALKWLLAEKK